MKGKQMQQKTERRISGALRIVLVALLLVVQIGMVLLLTLVLQQYVAWVYAVLELLALICTLRIYNRPGGGTYKASWIVLILAMPVVGLILYLLWDGERPSKRLNLKSVKPVHENEQQREHSALNVEKLRRKLPAWERLATYLERQGFLLYQNTTVRYLPTGEAYLEDMLERMRQAEHFIFLEYYIVGRGQIWDRVKEILLEKVRHGVEVKFIYDDFGSMLRMPDEELDQLRAAGIGVACFNPIHQYVNRIYFNYRSHRKITAIDGNIAYAGGVNVADEYANLVERFGYWKDTGVRLEGEGAWGLTREFIHMWERLGGQMEQDHDYYRPHGPMSGAGWCQALADGPDNNPTSVAEDVFLQMICGARQMVYLTSPYLAIDENMRKALCIAGNSGVDVRLMMPGIPDKKYAYLVAESYFGELLQNGVKIYTYTPGFIHSKTVLADREVAFVGTVNMDYRSFQLHFENGVVFYDSPAIESLLEDMEQTMDQSRLVTWEDWKKRSWLRKLLGSTLRIFSAWM